MIGLSSQELELELKWFQELELELNRNDLFLNWIVTRTQTLNTILTQLCLFTYFDVSMTSAIFIRNFDHQMSVWWSKNRRYATVGSPLISVQNRHRFSYPNSLLDPSPGTIKVIWWSKFLMKMADVIETSKYVNKHSCVKIVFSVWYRFSN